METTYPAPAAQGCRSSSLAATLLGVHAGQVTAKPFPRSVATGYLLGARQLDNGPK